MNNSVSYASPSLNGFKLRALYGAGENTGQPGGARIGSIHSASLQFDQGRLSANPASETRKTTAASTDRFYGAGASWQFDLARVGLLAQARRDDIGAAANNAFSASVLVPVGTGAVLVDAGRFKSRSVAGNKASSISVRYDHNLSKRTVLYAGAALAVTPGPDPRSLITGIRHTF